MGHNNISQYKVPLRNIHLICAGPYQTNGLMRCPVPVNYHLSLSRGRAIHLDTPEITVQHTESNLPAVTYALSNVAGISDQSRIPTSDAFYDADNTGDTASDAVQPVRISHAGSNDRAAGVIPVSADTYEASVRTMAAGLPGGTLPLPFMDSINAANQQMGNRAFLRWVGGLLARREDRCQETYAGTIMEAGLLGAGWPCRSDRTPGLVCRPAAVHVQQAEKERGIDDGGHSGREIGGESWGVAATGSWGHAGTGVCITPGETRGTGRAC